MYQKYSYLSKTAVGVPNFFSGEYQNFGLPNPASFWLWQGAMSHMCGPRLCHRFLLGLLGATSERQATEATEATKTTRDIDDAGG